VGRPTFQEYSSGREWRSFDLGNPWRIVSPSWRIPCAYTANRWRSAEKRISTLAQRVSWTTSAAMRCQLTVRRLTTSGGEISTTGVAASGASVACLPGRRAPQSSASHADGFEQSTALSAGILDRAEAATHIHQSVFRDAQKPSPADEITVRVDRV
jgi:hypothetical protein